MKLYYDTKIDQLIIVSKYQASKLYSYCNEIFFILKKESPRTYSSLIYIGEFGTGDIYYE